MTPEPHSALPTGRLIVSSSRDEDDWCDRKDDGGNYKFCWVKWDGDDPTAPSYASLGLPFAKVYGPLGEKWDSPVASQRAALIVRAVNSYAAMLAALERLCADYDTLGGKPFDRVPGSTWSQARAAIALARARGVTP